MLNLFNNLAFY